MKAVRVFDALENLWVGARAIAEVDHAALEVAPELRHVGIRAVEKCNSVGGQCGDELELRAGDTGLTFGESLDVRSADVGDDTPVWSGDAGERGNLAKMIHAHLDDGILVLGFKAQQLQRKAVGVVEIALRFEDVELRPESRSDCLFGCGLACGSGHGYDVPAPLAADMSSERLKRNERIFGDEQRNGKRRIGQSGNAGSRYHGSHGAVLDGGRNEIVSVKLLSAHGKEEFTGRQGAGVDGVTAGHASSRLRDAGRRLKHRACADGCLCEREIHCTLP